MKGNNRGDEVEGKKIKIITRKFLSRTPTSMELKDENGRVVDRKMFFMGTTDRGGNATIQQSMMSNGCRVSNTSLCAVDDAIIGDSLDIYATNKFPSASLVNNSGRHKAVEIVLSGHAYSIIKLPIERAGLSEVAVAVIGPDNP